ncbi:MAG: hypothetical protein ACREUK_10210 [Burkholderiales bacterium]
MSLAVLALGLCAAAAIHLTATDGSSGAVGYEVINGVAFLGIAASIVLILALLPQGTAT